MASKLKFHERMISLKFAVVDLFLIKLIQQQQFIARIIFIFELHQEK